MNQRKKIRFAILGVALLCAATSGSAMTLGRARGAVLLGQPLKLSVPVQLDSGEGPSVLCFEADVFYGDTRQDASRVAVSSDYLPQSRSAIVSVISHDSVNEPVVSVYLRAGCEYKATRRFVLLPDLASEVVMPVNRMNEVQQPVTPSIPQQRQSTIVDRPLKSTPVKTPVLTEPDGGRKTVTSKPSVPRATPVLRPHLKLLPLDLAQERDPTLKLSSELILGESENLQKRAEAAAMWRSLNATPEDILNSEARRQSMEVNLKELQIASASNSQALKELGGRLEAAESQRYANPLVYGLIGMLFLCSIGLGYILFRRRNGRLETASWWRTEEASNRPHLSPVDRSEAVVLPPDNCNVASAVPDVVAMPIAGNTGALTGVDIDLHLDVPSSTLKGVVAGGGEVGSRAQTPQLDSSSRPSGHVDFSHSMSPGLRAVNTQEMIDVRQQAEFFMTLGQHDEALGLLKDCVDGRAESNPLVYLDLLRILHTLGRKAEFDQYRNEFNALFSGNVPTYASFNLGGEALEAYPDICRAIEAFWPSEQAIAYIEECLVRDISGGAKRGIDLEAFRDLLMLHGLATRLVSDSESTLMPFIASKVGPVEAVADLSERGVDFELQQVTQPVFVDGIDIGNLSVDLDLSEPPGNLIDFDAADFALPDRSLPRKS